MEKLLEAEQTLFKNNFYLVFIREVAIKIFLSPFSLSFPPSPPPRLLS